MSYAVYSTRGFILGSGQSGEASKIYSIYTEDFGLIHARAQSVRTLQSKLRYNLEDYSFVSISLVRGKEIWRLVGSQTIDTPKYSHIISARVLNLVKRLVQGEERNDKLFIALLSLVDEALQSEVKILSKILSALGYLDLKSIDGKTDREIIPALNKALKETQL